MQLLFPDGNGGVMNIIKTGELSFDDVQYVFVNATHSPEDVDFVFAGSVEPYGGDAYTPADVAFAFSDGDGLASHDYLFTFGGDATADGSGDYTQEDVSFVFSDSETAYTGNAYTPNDVAFVFLNEVPTYSGGVYTSADVAFVFNN